MSPRSATVIPLQNEKDPYLEDIPVVSQDFIDRNCLKVAKDRTAFLMTSTRFNILNLKSADSSGTFKNIVNFKRVNDIKSLNNFMAAVNERLEDGGVFIGIGETSRERKSRLLNKFPPILNILYYTLDYLLKRVAPKVPIANKLYFLLTDDRNTVMPLAEILGRVQYCGFKIIEYQEIENVLHFAARKVATPDLEVKATYGVICKMKRKGLHGRDIWVYKIRTMHAYSEYLQDYVYEKNKLKKGGKLKDDFRLTKLGPFLRRYWIDELPMIINLLKGEMKLIGVRPLSLHYSSLYESDLQKKRTQVKPGFLPPYYADMPNTIEEIQASEERYLDAYFKSPFRTDLKYFFNIVGNILFRRARSS